MHAKLTVTEASELTGYSEGHIRWLVRESRIAAERVGQRVMLIDRASLMSYATTMREVDRESWLDYWNKLKTGEIR